MQFLPFISTIYYFQTYPKGSLLDIAYFYITHVEGSEDSHAIIVILLFPSNHNTHINKNT